MHSKRQVAGYIFKVYSDSRWAVRLFILIRYLVCPWQKLMAHINSVSSKGNLLDIGCGHGLLLHLIQLHAKGRRFCVGMDHDPGKVAVAIKSVSNNPRITVIDSSQQAQYTQKFDCITLIDVLYAVAPEDWPGIWKLIHKRLKPDGVLIIKETVNQPKWKYWICLIQEIMATRILRYTKGQFPFLPAADFYLKALSQNGFEIIEHQSIDQGYLWPHYLFVAKRSSVR